MTTQETLDHTTSPTSVARTLLALNTAYFQAKVLQSAVELGLFGVLAEKPASADALCTRLGLHPVRAADFLDALVGLGLLERKDGRYANRPGVAEFLTPGGPRYLGDSIAQHARLHYRAWASLTQVLSGESVLDQKDFRKDFQDLDNVRRLMGHMDVFNSFVAHELDRCIDWARYSTFLDVGGARGNVAAHLVRTHGHLAGGVFDLPAVEPLFDEHMAALGTAEKVRFTAGDFFADPLPRADVIILGHVLHDWPPTARETLVKRVHDAVEPGGIIVVYDAMLDDDRQDARSLLQSLNCSIMRDGGSEYTVGECRGYVERAGFRFESAERIDSLTGDRVLVAAKPS
ncbi:methyltransferase [Streptomyces minutiscleroticus]|uniref:O-methyltransferase n=3 Tax=Streptomyces TaxID=1883 RepID=A0A918NLY1_9ACTN|nr:methyltransferase [Streptomyces minutiscleroticus]AGG12556.1 S-adenosyl methyltransferase [Streptomyces sp. 275]AXB74574.1 O-methyltransferase [Streptomyces roseiscleroticus]GGX79908.1 O-methyltransferase [Streptomyces minutiscleroticus]